ncbi:MAG TPA: hypothetical protein VHS28_03515 [Chloroflexota bacterium]|nr:hypothetical protein [Chloroflexota bacterium]
MTEATGTTTTVSIAIDEDAVYKDCRDFNKHVDEGQMAHVLGDTEGALEHAVEAINIMARLLNEILPDEVWDRFGERAMAEHVAAHHAHD